MDNGPGLLISVFYLFIFPGAVFLISYGLLCEWVDRRVYARLQNRMGPPIYQPLADVIKLLAKEDIIPRNADRILFHYTPVFALAAVMVPVMTIPIWSSQALFPYQGDLVVALYLLSIPTLALFLIGWSSTSLYPLIGAFRAATMLFGYEVPMILACLSGGVLAGSWSISDITSHFMLFPAEMVILIPGFFIALLALEAKLERSPFDIPQAETEIVGGTLTEFSGKKLAVMHLTTDIGLVIGASLLAAVFLGGFVLPDGTIMVNETDFTLFFNTGLYFLKTLSIVFILAVVRTLFARFRIDQMIHFSWKYLAFAGFLQLFIAVTYVGVLKGLPG